MAHDASLLMKMPLGVQGDDAWQSLLRSVFAFGRRWRLLLVRLGVQEEFPPWLQWQLV